MWSEDFRVLASMEKKFCILHELGSKIQLRVCGFSVGPGGKALGKFTIFSLKLV